MTLLGEIHNQGLGIAAGSAEGGGVVSPCRRPRRRARARGARPDGARRARHGEGPCPRQGLARGRRREGRARRVATISLSCSLAAARPICAGRSSCCEVAAKAEIPDAQHALGVLYLQRPRRRPGHERGGALVPAGGRERQHGRRGRVRDPALQRRRRRQRREARRRAISAAPPPRATPSPRTAWRGSTPPAAACRRT